MTEQSTHQTATPPTPSSDSSNFLIQRIYIKDISFESPATPASFTNDWHPEVEINLNSFSNALSDNHHEVVLSITTTVKSNNKLVFLVEVKQAGLFQILGLNQQELHQALGSFCPNILFPFAREVIADLVSRGGFPQLLLAPVNFDAMYQQHLQQSQQEANSHQGDSAEQ